MWVSFRLDARLGFSPVPILCRTFARVSSCLLFSFDSWTRIWGILIHVTREREREEREREREKRERRERRERGERGREKERYKREKRKRREREERYKREKRKRREREERYKREKRKRREREERYKREKRKRREREERYKREKRKREREKEREGDLARTCVGTLSGGARTKSCGARPSFELFTFSDSTSGVGKLASGVLRAERSKLLILFPVVLVGSSSRRTTSRGKSTKRCLYFIALSWTMSGF